MQASSNSLSATSFVDLCIGEGFADLRGAPGTGASREAVPEYLEGDVAVLRALCLAHIDATGEAEFTLEHDAVLYRVTVMNNLRAAPVMFLRRIASDIRDIELLGLRPLVLSFLMEAQRPGLILVSGDMGAGKTQTASSLVTARLRRHGGLAIAVENPPETNLDGKHGPGRCIQVPVTSKNGGYRELLRQAMRTGASTLLIGEIRDNATALEAIRHSNNGTCVISTVHGSQLADALSRTVALARCEDMPHPEAQLADGLTAVIHQELIRTPRAGGGHAVNAALTTLCVTGKDAAPIRNRIRERNFHQVMQDVENQKNRDRWDS